MRTTNSVEGFNFKLNAHMMEMHPTIWKFIDRLKKLDESVNSDVIGYESGYVPFSKKKWRLQEARKLAIVRFDHNDLMPYIRAIGNEIDKKGNVDAD